MKLELRSFLLKTQNRLNTIIYSPGSIPTITSAINHALRNLWASQPSLRSYQLFRTSIQYNIQPYSIPPFNGSLSISLSFGYSHPVLSSLPYFRLHHTHTSSTAPFPLGPSQFVYPTIGHSVICLSHLGLTHLSPRLSHASP